MRRKVMLLGLLALGAAACTGIKTADNGNGQGYSDLQYREWYNKDSTVGCFVRDGWNVPGECVPIIKQR